jgi:superfamily II DNA or RNA helicase
VSLRRWQSSCITKALKAYKSGQRHFLAVATPGAGKTTMASALTAELYRQNAIDLVLCFVPSRNVRNSFRYQLEQQNRAHFDGNLGASGKVLTYQCLGRLSERFWSIFDTRRVFVILDEIHHCGGIENGVQTLWGRALIEKIQSKAQYTLSLSGTPWRTDKLPVTLSAYCRMTKQVAPDFIYGLHEAIKDNVCRVPKVIAIDNSQISVHENCDVRTYNSIESLLDSEPLPYQSLLELQPLIEYLLQQAVFKLSEIRYSNPNAAGLVVASSIKHAEFLAEILENTFKEACVLVSHKSQNSEELLEKFRTSRQKWIVSVGMISEGTDIPRLQICCHLSRVKTELHFRQVLGRILRSVRDENHKYAYLYTLAEASLLEFSDRLQQDIPEISSVLEVDTPTSSNILFTGELSSNSASDEPKSVNAINTNQLKTEFYPTSDLSINVKTSLPAQELSFYGYYFQKMIELSIDCH